MTPTPRSRPCERARAETDDLQGSVQGVGGDVWSWVPVAGGPVRDVRRLGNALDQLVAGGRDRRTHACRRCAARRRPSSTTATSTSRRAGGRDRRLRGGVDATRRRAGRARRRRRLPRSWSATRLAEARDQAAGRGGPAGRRPRDDRRRCCDQLPKVLGARRPAGKYLLALLNPAEMLYSGGAPLTVVPVDRLRRPADRSARPSTPSRPPDVPAALLAQGAGQPVPPRADPPVARRHGPDWPVVGRGVAQRVAQPARPQHAGAGRGGRRRPRPSCCEITGPMDVADLGTLDGDNLVEKLVGSYDDYPDTAAAQGGQPRARPGLRRAPAGLRQRAGRQGPGRWPTPPAGRHFAALLPRPRRAGGLRRTSASAAGSPTPSTTTSASSPRTRCPASPTTGSAARSRTRRRAARGRQRAASRMEVEVHNDSPPYVQPVPDPRRATSPAGAPVASRRSSPPAPTFDAVEVDGEPIETSSRNYFGRYFMRPEHRVRAAGPPHPRCDVRRPCRRGARRRRARLPAGARPAGHGRPAGRPGPGQLPARLRRRAVRTGLPDGWSTRGGRVATYTTDALDERPSRSRCVARP